MKEEIKRVTEETAQRRNRLMTELANEVFIAYVLKDGNLDKLVSESFLAGKTISTFELQESANSQ